MINKKDVEKGIWLKFDCTSLASTMTRAQIPVLKKKKRKGIIF
jgi:hypothetical protein